MNIVLTAINAKYIHSNLAVYSLKAYAKAYADSIQICEYTINQYVDDILMDLYRRKPDVLLFSCYLWNIDMVKAVAQEMKKIMPQLPIWVGGPEVSYEVETFLRENPAIDGVMLGEGEETFLQLTSYYNEVFENEVEGQREVERSLKAIAGIAYREDGNVVVQGGRYLLDMDQLPFPYEDLEPFSNKIIYYESSRGCPFSCSYCLSSIDKSVRFRSVSLVQQELQFFLDRRVPQVKFVDRTFNCSHDHAMAIWQYIKDHDNGVTNFHFEISADLLREEEIQLLQSMRVGLVQLEIGVQSTNPATIAGIHRSMKLDKLQTAVERVRQGKNIHQHLDLIAGLPYEDYERFGQSYDEVYQMHPDQLQLGFLKVLKGSQMYEEQRLHEIRYKSYPPYEVLSTKWLSFDEILLLKQIEDMVEVYYNSGQFHYTLEYLMHFYESPFSFYEALALFYQKNETIGVQYTRVARCEKLLDFVRQELPQSVEPVKELLVYDLYLRENMKTRPAFASSQEAYKDQYYKVCKQIQEQLQSGENEAFPGYEGCSAKQLVRMLHIEHFTYDIAELVATGQERKADSDWIFDYKNRNPLTKEAATHLCPVLKEKEKER